MRPLSAEERALWRRVTADVRPVSMLPVEADASAGTTVAAPSVPVLAAPAAAPVKPRHLPKGIGQTLDGSWDRKLREGDIVPDRVVDLHGLTVDRAHARAVDAVESAAREGARVVVLVTGKAPAAGSSRLDRPLRGIIRASIGDWLAASNVARSIAAIRPAHVRHGGNGALYIVLRRVPEQGRTRGQKLS